MSAPQSYDPADGDTKTLAIRLVPHEIEAMRPGPLRSTPTFKVATRRTLSVCAVGTQPARSGVHQPLLLPRRYRLLSTKSGVGESRVLQDSGHFIHRIHDLREDCLVRPVLLAAPEQFGVRGKLESRFGWQVRTREPRLVQCPRAESPLPDTAPRTRGRRGRPPTETPRISGRRALQLDCREWAGPVSR